MVFCYFHKSALSNEREARFPCIYIYNVYEYAWNYLYKPVPKSGLGLASPPRLGASPLATQKVNQGMYKGMRRAQMIPKNVPGKRSKSDSPEHFWESHRKIIEKSWKTSLTNH